MVAQRQFYQIEDELEVAEFQLAEHRGGDEHVMWTQCGWPTSATFNILFSIRSTISTTYSLNN